MVVSLVSNQITRVRFPSPAQKYLKAVENTVEKFSWERHGNDIAHLPFSYFTCAPYLEFCAWTTIANGERLLLWNEEDTGLTSIFLPQNPLNWTLFPIARATLEDIARIDALQRPHTAPILEGTEFYYDARSFLEPNAKNRREIQKLLAEKHPTLYYSYPPQKILAFYEFWKGQRERLPGIEEDEHFFRFCLERLERYSVQQVYAEIGGELAGFTWGVKHYSGNWVGLHLKGHRGYRGLSHLLHMERTKLFGIEDVVCLGTEAKDPKLRAHKFALHPSRTVDYYSCTVIT